MRFWESDVLLASIILPIIYGAAWLNLFLLWKKFVNANYNLLRCQFKLMYYKAH